MAVVFKSDWKPANLSGTTYTFASPEVPVSQTLTFDANSTIVASSSPWTSGQYLIDLDNASSSVITRTVSGSTVPNATGRYLIEFAPDSAGGDNIRIFDVSAPTPNNGHLWVYRRGLSDDHLIVGLEFNSGGTYSQVDLGAFPTNPSIVEVIYDTTNGTASLRNRARVWTVGGSPGSFVDATDTFSGGGSMTQPTTMYIGWGGGTVTGFKFGRVFFSDSITDDLSALLGGGGATGPAIGARYLIGPWVR